MLKITLKIDGMACGMCESHINDCIRNHFRVKSVKSSHTRGETVIVAGIAIDEARLRDAIEKTGYKLLSIQTEEYKKKGLFGLFGG